MSDIQSILAAAGNDMVTIRVSNLLRRHGYRTCREAMDAEGSERILTWPGVGSRIIGIIEEASGTGTTWWWPGGEE